MGIFELILRISLTFFVLFVLMRILGRQEISQMTFLNFLSAIVIGSMASDLVLNENISIRNGVIALIGWSAFSFTMEFVNLKFKKARKILEGDPLIVVKQGKIMEDALRSTRLDIDNLLSMFRQQGVFSIKDVEFAIYETSGKISIMKKEDKKSATKGDLNIPSSVKVFPIPVEVISDGSVNTMNLAKLRLDQRWLHHQLQQAGVEAVTDVFYAEIQTDGTLYIDTRNDHLDNS